MLFGLRFDSRNPPWDFAMPSPIVRLLEHEVLPVAA
jgi:hypothetical protein